MEQQYVPHTPELDRVLALPRRDWAVEALLPTGPISPEELTRRCTDLLRTPVNCRACGGAREHVRPNGQPCPLRHIPLSLYLHQAVALVEAAWFGGLLGAIGVGKGKTLISFLLAYVLESARPMLVLQAGLIPKAERNWRELAVYWMIPNWIRLISYEVLGRVSAKEELERFSPDLLVCDEVHKLKSRKAAVTKRFEAHIEHHRYHEKKHRNCRLCEAGAAPRALLHTPAATKLRFVGMSGTITTKSLRDFAHIAHWCLPGGRAPLPGVYHELERWRLALDDGINPLSRVEPGALLKLCDHRENDAPDATTAARRGFGRRLRETPGVVVTTDDTVKASLQIEAFDPPHSPAIDDAFMRLRGDSKRSGLTYNVATGQYETKGDPAYSGWKMPDGWSLVDGIEVYRHALELVLGFYYRPKKRPPEFWLEARRLWGAFVRRTIKLGKYDSDLDVANHAHQFNVTVDDMLKIVHDDETREHEDRAVGRRHVYDHWAKVRDTFDLQKEAIWICDSVVQDAAKWLHEHPRGIVWTGHIAFGERLAQVSGRPYFGQEGRDKTGMLIDDATGSVIASLAANKTGRDLQFKWSENRFYTAMGDAAECQQALARTHRNGQDDDTVTAGLFMGCIEHALAIELAQSRARYIEDIETEPQKLNFADISIPPLTEYEQRGRNTPARARWSKDRV